MDGRRRKYIGLNSKHGIPSRTRRYWKRRKLAEAIDKLQTNQDMNLTLQSSDHNSDNDSEKGEDGGGINNLDQESSDNRDAHDSEDIAPSLNLDCSDHNSDNDSEKAEDGGGVNNLDQESLNMDSSDHEFDLDTEEAQDGSGITQNLDQNFSHHDSDSGSENAHVGGGINMSSFLHNRTWISLTTWIPHLKAHTIVMTLHDGRGPRCEMGDYATWGFAISAVDRKCGMCWVTGSCRGHSMETQSSLLDLGGDRPTSQLELNTA
ncbi:uncharacterized protein LOC134100015 [Sardina pilchardus]|uniref:uncharacterized protein LOC134100015 n=1 Tax=Sardina pilchardus TaxID=27697 RepID=UPI002E12C35E